MHRDPQYIIYRGVLTPRGCGEVSITSVHKVLTELNITSLNRSLLQVSITYDNLFSFFFSDIFSRQLVLYS